MPPACCADGITNDKFTTVASMSSNLKKLAACWTGQCRGNAYGDTGWFWECSDASCDTGTWTANGATWSNDFSGQAWTITGAGAYHAGAGPQQGTPEELFHVWGSGVVLWNDDDHEFNMHNGGEGTRGMAAVSANNGYQVRVK